MESSHSVSQINTSSTLPHFDLDVHRGEVLCLSPKTKSKLVKLVGEKCIVDCHLNNISVNALWDTGAQVCLISSSFIQSHLPNAEIRPVNELLTHGLVLTSASNDDIPFKGWTELEFRLGKGVSVLNVPFLISDSPSLVRPIIGFNVIQHYINGEGKSALGGAIPDLSSKSVNSVTRILHDSSDTIANVRSGPKGIQIPGKSSQVIRAHVRTGNSNGNHWRCLFVPSWSEEGGLEFEESLVTIDNPNRVRIVVRNPTNKSLYLNKNVQLGTLETVSSVVNLACAMQDVRNTIDQNTPLVEA